MADQKVIDWFLEQYDTGNAISQEAIDLLVKGLRARRKRGKPSKKAPLPAILALYELCTADLIAEYTQKENDSAIRKSLKRSKDQGWQVIRLDNYIDKNGKPLVYKKGRLSREYSRQIHLIYGNEPAVYCFNFKLNESNQLELLRSKF